MTAKLIDEDGAVTDEFVRVLKDVFERFTATPREPVALAVEDVDLSDIKDAKPGQAALTRTQLNAFAQETNGSPMDDDTFKEICEYFDCVFVGEQDNKEPALTLMGFTQLYELQTGAEEYETRKDLATWGYNDDLEYVGPGQVPIPPKPVVEEESKDGDLPPPAAASESSKTA
ncbi:hypothetical protein ACM66B_004852 [Microbotryomycetes sp. NB124-2]